MKNNLLKIASILMLVMVLLSFVGCDSGAIVYELANFQPTANSEAYDTDLLYKNLSQFWGGDSGVIYVSEEESPEYGGYFYQYMSGCAGVYNGGVGGSSVASDINGNVTDDPDKIHHYGHITCTRSKDLNDWELVGAVDHGYCLMVMPDEWVSGCVWAPEAIYDAKSGKYYLYFSAQSWINDGSNPDIHYSNDVSGTFSRYYLGIACSDTPVGPFRLVSSLEYYGENGTKNANGEVVNLNGEVVTGKNSAIDFGYYFKNNPNSIYRDQLADLDYPIFCAIDPSPFFDENGDLYLYFCNHGSNNMIQHSVAIDDPIAGSEVWGLKMKDMITPEYESLRVCVPGVQSTGNGGQFDNYNGYVRVEYKGGDTAVEEWPVYEQGSYKRYLSWNDNDPESEWNVPNNTDDYNNDGLVHEGPQMITTKDSQGKTVYLLTYAPLGVGAARYDVMWTYSYNPIKGFTKPKGRDIAYILGVDGNNNFMTNLGHAAIVNVGGELWVSHWEYPEAFSGWDTGRIHACTKLTWVSIDGYDFPIPAANGPTKSCQALPAIATGYTNISGDATITIKGKAEGVEYLNDGLVVTANKFKDRQLFGNGKTTITLTFDELRSIRGLLIHNSYDFEYAFKNITNVKFTLADGSIVGIREIGLDMNFVTEPSDSEAGWIEPGLAAVSTFNEIQVSKIEFTVENFYNSSNQFAISEIEVLGK